MSTDNKETKKKSGLFSKLKNLAFEDSESSEDQERVAVSTPTPIDGQTKSNFVYSSVTPQVQQTPIPVQNLGGQFDEKFYNSFVEVLEKNNIEGVDYLEFSKAKKNMDSIPGMAEPMKYQSTYASLKANSNLTKDYLLQSADVYLGKLDEEEKEFNAEMQNEINLQVNSRIEQAKNKLADIQKKQDQITALQTEMGALQAEISQMNLEAQNIQSNIDSTAKNFKVTLDAFKGQINADKSNIQNFLV